MKSAPARSAQISSCSSAAALNVSPAPTRTLRPCSRSFCASLPTVVVLPVPLTPTTRITVGLAPSAIVGGAPNSSSISSASASPRSSELATGLEAPHDLGRGADADVAVDESLLEPLPGLLVGGVERAGRDLGRQRAAALRERVAQAAEEAAPLRLVGRGRLVTEELCPGSRHGATLPAARPQLPPATIPAM